MDTLDLHNTRHEEAKIMVEEFILLNELPLRIITGHSNTMKSIVYELASKYDMRAAEESWVNQGSLIITDKR